MSRRRGAVIPDRNLALWGGVACLCFGSWMLYDAYEARGRTRPFVAKLLPGA